MTGAQPMPASMPTGTDADLELMRASALLESNPAEAARRASAILEQSAQHQAASLLLQRARGIMPDRRIVDVGFSLVVRDSA